MAKAAAEERRLAIERNDIIHGIPCTIVEGDGSYMKRSYVNSKYDSPACCIVLIGKYTNKILDIVVKQKTCAICEYSYNKGVTPKKRKWFRTHGHELSSTSVESTAIGEGLEYRETQFNIQSVYF